MKNRLLLVLAALCLLCTSSSAISPKPFQASQEQKDRIYEALKLEDKGDYKEAFELMTKVAEEKNEQAVIFLSVMYRKGQGTPKSSKMELEWLQKGADWHFPLCLWALGLKYANGDNGLAQSDSKCAELLQQSVDLGCPDAMVSLGAMYSEGRGGLEKSSQQAVALFLKAANLGNAEGMDMMGKAEALGMDGPPNTLEAADWFSKAIAAGSKKSIAPFGEELLDLNRPADAIKIFTKGAALGLSDCMYQLGFLYDGGYHGKYSSRKLAISWYRKAAKLGNEAAKKALHRFGY